MFTTLLEVTNYAKEIVKGDFNVVTPGEVDLTDTDQALIRASNWFWDTKVYHLATQVRYLLISLFKSYQYQPNQLGEGPGLSVCARIREAKEHIDLSEHIKFVETIHGMTMDMVFTVLDAEASYAAQLRKRKRDKRQEIYDKLKEATDAKIRVIEEDIWGELVARYETFRTRVVAQDIDLCLHTGAAGAGATATNAPTIQRTPVYKPNEDSLNAGVDHFPGTRYQR